MGRKIYIPQPKTRRPYVRRARRGNIRRRANVPEWGSLSAARTLPSCNYNQMYSYMNIQLADFDRAYVAAQAYQQFRIKSVKLTFKPSFDTFTTSGPQQKPYLYYMLDKTGSVPTTVTIDGLKAMGSKPRSFDEKQLTATWAPTVLQNVGVNNSLTPPLGNQNKPLRTPWLTTSQNPQSPTFTPNNVDHLGIYWIADGGGFTGGTYEVDCEVQFQFRKPNIANGDAIGTVAATPVMLHTAPQSVPQNV